MSYQIFYLTAGAIQTRYRSGNKATLLARLTEYDEQQQRDALTSPPIRIRRASSAPGLAGVPGIPYIPSPPSNARLDYLPTLLPDLTPQLVIESAPIVRGILTQRGRAQITDPIPAFRSGLLGLIEGQGKAAARTRGIK